MMNKCNKFVDSDILVTSSDLQVVACYADLQAMTYLTQTYPSHGVLTQTYKP